MIEARPAHVSVPMHWILDYGTIALKVLTVLIGQPGGRWTEGQPALADACECSVRPMIKAIEQLEEAGLVRRERRGQTGWVLELRKRPVLAGKIMQKIREKESTVLLPTWRPSDELVRLVEAACPRINALDMERFIEEFHDAHEGQSHHDWPAMFLTWMHIQNRKEEGRPVHDGQQSRSVQARDEIARSEAHDRRILKGSEDNLRTLDSLPRARQDGRSRS